MDKKITTSEIVGELRRSARLFKVFEKAADAAEILHTHEKDVKALKKEIESLTIERDNLNIECEEVVKSIDDARAKAKEIEAGILKNSAIANAKMDDDKKASKAKATKMIKDAEAKVSNILSSIDDLQIKAKVALNDKKRAEDDLKKVINKIKSTKESFINSL